MRATRVGPGATDRAQDLVTRLSALRQKAAAAADRLRQAQELLETAAALGARCRTAMDGVERSLAERPITLTAHPGEAIVAHCVAEIRRPDRRRQAANRPMQGRTFINVRDPTELSLWACRLHVTVPDVLDAVARAGPKIDDVLAYFDQ